MPTTEPRKQDNLNKIPLYFKGTPFKLRSQSPAKELGDDEDIGYQGAELVNVTGKNILGDEDNTNATLTNTAAENIKSSDYATNVKTASKTTSAKQWLIDNPGGGNVSAADIRRRKKAIKAQARANKKLEAKGLQTIDMIPPSK